MTANPAPPPAHCPEAEDALLGNIISGTETRPSAMDLLVPDDFFSDDNRQIFKKMIALELSGKPVNDSVLLYDTLAAGEKERLGPVIASLCNPLYRCADLARYADIIKAHAEVRRTLKIAAKIVHRLENTNGDASSALQDVSVLSAQLSARVEQKRNLGFKTSTEVFAGGEVMDWLVEGYVITGAITELVAKIKTGKTTFMMELAKAVLNGSQFLGRPTRKSPIVYLTEQNLVSFRQAMERAGLRGREDLIVLPFAETRGHRWPEVADAAAKECRRIKASLMVIDTLAQFAGLTGDRENNAGDALEAMLPVQQAAADGIGVVVVRHERKSGGDVSDSGRGSSAFAGAVDIVISLRKLEGNSPKNRRVLDSLSRFSETPSDLVIELTDAGYVALGERQAAAIRDAKDQIVAAAPESEADAIDLKELADAAKASRPTAQRAVDQLVRDGVLARVGAGKRGNAYRYFVSAQPAGVRNS